AVGFCTGVGFACLAGAGAGVGAFGAGAAAGVVAGAAAASAPHSALRKSFHFMPLSVPAVCAALYFALHSFMVSAAAGEAEPAMASISAVQRKAERMDMTNLLDSRSCANRSSPPEPRPRRLYRDGTAAKSRSEQGRAEAHERAGRRYRPA